MSREKQIDFDKYVITKDGVITSKFYKSELKGNKDKNGYLTVHLVGKKSVSYSSLYKYHRVIWYYFNGEIPDGYEIDHINGIRDDNRLCNLRCVTHTENMNNPITIEKLKENNKGEKNGFWGKKHTDKTRFKMSNAAQINYKKRERDKLGRFN